RLTGPGSLDRSVERQQVGLAGDSADQIDDPVDLLGMAGQGVDLVRSLVEPALHVRSLALQLAEMLLVAQRRRGDLLGMRLVLAQLSGEVFERIPQMRDRVAEANQVAGHAAVIVELPTAGSIGPP